MSDIEYKGVSILTSQQELKPDGSPKVARAVGLVSTLILAVLSYQLNASMVTPALPAMAEALGVDENAVSQVSSLFFLAGAVGGVVLARWSDFIGRRKTLFIVLGVLSVGTVLCIFAPNLPVLLVGRILQGASSATFQIAYVLLSETLTAKAFGTAMGFITAINGGVGGVDGYLGGLMVEAWGFRSIFVVILAIGILAAVAVYAVVPKGFAVDEGSQMDWVGAGVFSLFLICITYFVQFGSSEGWVSGASLAFLAASIVMGVVFVLVEIRQSSPLFDIKQLRSRMVWPVLATTLLTLSGVFAVINFTLVMFSQNQEIGFGLTPSVAALMFLLPPAMIGVIAAPVSGWLAGRFGWTRVLRVGLSIVVASLIVIAVFPTAKWVVFAMVAILGISYNGLTLTTINGLGVLQSPPDAPGALPGFNGAAFGIGASLGIGLVAPYVVSGSVAGVTTALWTSTGITIAALISSLLIKPRQNQAS